MKNSLINWPLIIALLILAICNLYCLDSPIIVYPPNNDSTVANIPFFSWSSVNSATKYRVQLSKYNDFHFCILDEEHINTTMVFNCLYFNSIFYLRINSSNGFETSNWSQVVKFKTVYYIWPPPTKLTPENGISNIHDTIIVLTCNDVEYANKYGFQIALDTNFTSIIKKIFVTPPSYTFSGLKSNTTYYWRCEAGDCNYNGEWSEIYSFTTGKMDNISFTYTNNEFILFPNPATTYLTVSSSNEEITFNSINIYNSLGIEIKRFNENELLGKSSINLTTDEFPSGIYYCTLNSGTNKITKSFVVIR